MTKSFRYLSLVLLAVTACGAAPAPAPRTPAPARPAQATTSSTGQRLVADIEAWEKTVLVQPASTGHGLGVFDLTIDGVSVSPPQGSGCAALVSCCEGFTGVGEAPKAMQMVCQLTVAKGPACGTALHTVETIVAEHGETLPSACPVGA